MDNVLLSKDERTYFSNETHEFLLEKGWKRREVGGEILYLKEESDYPPINFLDKPRKKRLSSLIQTIEKINMFFPKRSYESVVEHDIALTGKIKDTFLIGAAVQYFRDSFWGDDDPPQGNFFLPQPVVRVKYLKRISEGFTSSFVNISTVQLRPSFEEHLDHLDNWLDLFSELGLYIGDFILKVVPAERYGRGKKGNWSRTDGFSISINYLNLGLGDAGFIRVPTKKGLLDVSDIGFGLERILWALYKTHSYFDIIGPESEIKYSRFQLVDSMRSSTLLAMSNISKQNKDAFNQFRKLTKVAAKNYGLFDTMKLVRYYYDFWSNFIKPKRTVDETYYFLNSELEDRIKNEEGNL